jgi:NAD/NADP transhydrogenase beta subunit
VVAAAMAKVAARLVRTTVTNSTANETTARTTTRRHRIAATGMTIEIRVVVAAEVVRGNRRRLVVIEALVIAAVVAVIISDLVTIQRSTRLIMILVRLLRGGRIGMCDVFSSSLLLTFLFHFKPYNINLKDIF